jgi:hydroxymethylpyrimidine/phosphomethylpyrimidine kinase
VVGAQIDAITDDVTVAATKTGMLGSVASLEMVADRHRKLGPLVIDPVLRASTGKTLSPDGMVGAYRRVLIPLAAVVCPNLVEASELCDRVVDDVAAMYQAGRALLDLGAGAAVITGGHLAGDDVIDVFVSATEQAEFRRARVATTNDHGTGCTYSSAIAAYLARGESLIRATEQAGRFVERALLGAQGWSLGHGGGPLDQLGWPEQSG